MSDADQIDDMCCRASPLCWAVLACIIVMTVSIALDAYASWQYRSQVQVEAAFIQCLGGAAIDMGDTVVLCQVSRPIVPAML